MATFTKEQVTQTLTERLNLESPEFHLEQGHSGRWSGSIVSPSFAGLDDHDRQKRMWDALEAEFGADIVQGVGMLLAYTPEEWNVDLEV